jgi:hypothetical protein
MFRNLRLKRQPYPEPAGQPEGISAVALSRDPTLPISLRAINALPEAARRRAYRALLPPAVLAHFEIHPISWKGVDGQERVALKAADDSSTVSLSAFRAEGEDPFATLEIADNRFNSIDLNWLVLNDPAATRFNTDRDESGRPTLFGTVRRNEAEEERAMAAGLAPGQVRPGLAFSKLVLPQLEAFLATLGHRAYYLEPLTYASAWLFERRGFAYVSGHRLMDTIHTEFQPGGRLHDALDGRTPFRRPEQWQSVRGRAWAIQDGILEAIDSRWNGLRMVKQVGRDAGVTTFPDAVY